MTIINNEDMLFNGEHTPAGSTVEVSKELGQYLLGVKRARLPDAPVGGEMGSAPAPETTAVTGGETSALPKGDKKTT